jgi:hypothetical protein
MKTPKEHYADLERLTELIEAGRLTRSSTRPTRCIRRPTPCVTSKRDAPEESS